MLKIKTDTSRLTNPYVVNAATESDSMKKKSCKAKAQKKTHFIHFCFEKKRKNTDNKIMEASKYLFGFLMSKRIIKN